MMIFAAGFLTGMVVTYFLIYWLLGLQADFWTAVDYATKRY